LPVPHFCLCLTFVYAASLKFDTAAQPPPDVTARRDIVGPSDVHTVLVPAHPFGTATICQWPFGTATICHRPYNVQSMHATLSMCDVAGLSNNDPARRGGQLNRPRPRWFNC
jgi:hypothetical protein